MDTQPKETAKIKVAHVITPFNYSSVRLKDSMFKEQFEETVQYYLAIPNDDILKGFRERAGLVSPGKNLGGWYTGKAS